VPKPYIYFAMAFSVVAEWFKLLMRLSGAMQHHPIEP